MRRRGFSQIELLVGTMLMVVALIATLSLTSAAFRSQAFAYARSDTTTTVAQGIELMVRDLEPARDSVLVNATDLRIRYAALLSNGTYDRTTFDDPSEVEYFLGDDKGAKSTTGTVLWRQRGGPKGKSIVCKGVRTARFESLSPGVVRVSLDATGSLNSSATVLNRSVYLRNFVK